MPITDVGLLAGTAYKADKAMAMKAAQDQDCGWRLIDNVALDAVGGPVNWSEVAHQACRTTKDALARVEARREIIDEGHEGGWAAFRAWAEENCIGTLRHPEARSTCTGTAAR